MLLLGAVHLFAQGGPDSTRVDSAAVAPRASDSTARADSAAYDHQHDPVHNIDYGALLGSVVENMGSVGAAAFITKRDLVWERYVTTYDVLAQHLPARAVTMGAPGQLRTFSYAGAAPEAISVAYNGRPLLGAHGRAFQVDLYPAEFLERLEILRGARAAVFGNGESLIALNYVQPRYDAEGSYVRLWYAQAPNNTTNADVTFARNLGARTNMTIGFRRLASDGVFPAGNQRVNGWSARGALRWDGDDGLTVSLTELFSHHTRGAGGGLLTESDRDPLLAQVHNDSLSEQEVRHDLTLAARWYPTMLSRAVTDSTGPVPDTTTRFDAALFYSYVEGTMLAGDSSASVGASTLEGTVGARLGATSSVGRLRLLGNGSVQYGAVSGLRTDVGALGELNIGQLTQAILLRVGGKLAYEKSGTFLTAATEVVVRLSDSLTLRGTVRRSLLVGEDENCLLAGPPDADSVRSLATHYTQMLGEAELLWRSGRWNMALNGTLRNAAARSCQPFSDYTVTSLGLTASVPLGFLTLDNHIVATIEPEQYRAFPLVHGTSDLWARFLLFEGNLDLKLGTSLEYQSGQALLTYDDVAGSFNAPRANPFPDAQPPFPYWNAYAQARIGNAYLRIEMRNILGIEYNTLYRYPAFDRGVYLGVNWALVD